jgi:hypothetical protein
MNKNAKSMLRGSFVCLITGTMTLAFCSQALLAQQNPPPNGWCYEDPSVGIFSWSCSLAPVTAGGFTIGYTCAGGPCVFSSTAVNYYCAGCSFFREGDCACATSSTTAILTVYTGSCTGSILLGQSQSSCGCTWSGIAPTTTTVTVGTLNYTIYNANWQTACWD